MPTCFARLESKMLPCPATRTRAPIVVKTLHILALVLFVAALCLYMAASMAGAWALGAIAVALEAVAWVVTFTSRQSSRNGEIH